MADSSAVGDCLVWVVRVMRAVAGLDSALGVWKPIGEPLETKSNLWKASGQPEW